MKDQLTQKQKEDALSLSPEAKLDLIQIDLATSGAGQTTLRLTKFNTVTYLGATWEAAPFNMAEVGVHTQGEAKRPKLSIVNPDGAFSAWVHQGLMDSAIVTRYRLLKSDLDANIAAYEKNVWRVSKPLSLSKSLIVFELRSPLDGPMFLLPGRGYYPPEFSHVSL